ncbi:thermonuclease family protein [Nocardioides renjunii]|uniref:thermonuclease family protein n=1 Tax=Nocardioides renjunii TaxID=3095075 RepID=UPI002AFF78DF|nr:thermonuclease family protein [Nocardioides sp. S-34]WQQ22269.1 thermonuclease family protein [Nocardioides sp. S-34]
MIQHVARALSLLLAAIGLTTLAAPAHAIVDRDCGDFATQAAAQAFMLASGPGDPHGLDGSDDDGRACESNPCPCGTTAPQPLVGPGSTQSSQSGSQSGSHSGAQSGTDVVRRNVGNVVKVTDGDTLEVRVRGIGIRDVRIIGIDTPEVYGGAQCGGRRASQRMRELAPVGSTVTLLSDPSQDDRDRYGRLLRYVERRGKDVGRAQVNLGQAKVYVYDRTPFRRTAGYERVERSARTHHRGSWGTCWR